MKDTLFTLFVAIWIAIAGFTLGSLYGEAHAPPVPSQTDRIISACQKLGGGYVTTPDGSADCILRGEPRFISPDNLLP